MPQAKAKDIDTPNQETHHSFVNLVNRKSH